MTEEMITDMVNQITEEKTNEVPMVTLFCMGGGHPWQRESGRGKLPYNCPDHAPVKNTSTMLHCEAGNHEWERGPARGPKPKDCPEHRTAKAAIPSQKNANGMVVLTCEVGQHEWERPAQRGKKPLSCPEHAPIKSSVSKIVKVEVKSSVVNTEDAMGSMLEDVYDSLDVESIIPASESILLTQNLDFDDDFDSLDDMAPVLPAVSVEPVQEISEPRVTKSAKKSKSQEVADRLFDNMTALASKKSRTVIHH